MENQPETSGTREVEMTEEVHRETEMAEEQGRGEEQAVREEHPGAAIETNSRQQMPPPKIPIGQSEGQASSVAPPLTEEVTMTEES